MDKQTAVIYGRLPEAKQNPFEYGTISELFSSWGELFVSGALVTFIKEAPYSAWAEARNEVLGIVEGGEGVITFNGTEYPLKKGHVFKIFPGQTPKIVPKKSLTVLVVQLPGSAGNAEAGGEKLDELKVIDGNTVPGKAYEYESYGRELVTCNYGGGIGLLRFQFPIDKIPLHIHPHSGRLIRTISGEGYTYAQPKRYDMDPDTFCLFEKGTIHTNGPRPGSLYDVYAVQLPWVDSKIDEEHIAGDPNFVRYVDAEPPKPLWKTKADFERAIELHGKRNK